MHDCGLYSIEVMRPINETRMAARWKLGQALAKVEHGKPFPGSATMMSDSSRLTFRALTGVEVATLDVVRHDERLHVLAVELGELRLDTCDLASVLSVPAIDDDLFVLIHAVDDGRLETMLLDVQD
jgi:hypothetical protein